jgi:thiamine transport system ATP-binding protein
VVEVTPTPDELRLLVDVDGVGELPAIGAGGWLPAPGDRASVRIDRSRLAILRR